MELSLDDAVDGGFSAQLEWLRKLCLGWRQEQLIWDQVIKLEWVELIILFTLYRQQIR